MITRYTRMFEALAARGEGALIPFLMLGDPDLDTCLAHAEAAIAAGADALELGIPFSDPVADGPVVVAAANRALAAGTTPGRCFELVAALRARHADLPIGLLTYVNPVFARGIDAFQADAAAAGADSVLVADLPVRESAPFRAAARRHGIAPVYILPPDASPRTLSGVCDAGDGYTYVLGRRGVTGADRAARMPPPDLLKLLKHRGAPPAVVGFGVSTPDHARAAFAAGAAGVIVGSALIEAMADDDDWPGTLRAIRSAMRAA